MTIHDKARALAARSCKPLKWGYQELQRRGQEAKRRNLGTLSLKDGETKDFSFIERPIRLPYADN